MFSVEVRAGRLLEMRIGSTFPLSELNEFVIQVAAALRPQANRLVCCTDLRGTRILTPEVSDRLTEMMRGDNPRIERNAIIVNESALFSMQIERMLRAAGSPGRDSFRDVDAAQTWLGEVLGLPERMRLRVFLTQPIMK